MRTRPAILTAACLVALAACAEDEGPAPDTSTKKNTTKNDSQQAHAEGAPPRVDFDDLPPIPEPDVETINEAPVRAELRDALRRARANHTAARAVGTYGMKCFVYDFDDAARDCFRIAAALAPRSLRWTYYLAFAHENVGDQDLAMDAYERAIEIDGTYQPAYVRLAKLLLDVDPQRACELYERAAELIPDEARATWGLAQCARTNGELERAEALYRKAIRLEPSYAEAHFGLAQVLARTERRDEARLHFALQEAGRAPSDYRDPLAVELALAEGGTAGIKRNADARAKQGDVPGAIELLKDAFEEYPDYGGIRLQLAQMYLGAGKPELAKEQIALVREDLPENVGARSMLGAIHLQQQNTDEAERLFRAVLEDKSDDAASNWYLGLILIQKGKTDEALPYLDRGAALQTYKPNVQIQLAQIYGQLGRLAKAATCLRRAAIAKGGDEALIDEAERLESIAEQRESEDGAGG